MSRILRRKILDGKEAEELLQLLLELQRFLQRPGVICYDANVLWNRLKEYTRNPI